MTEAGNQKSEHEVITGCIQKLGIAECSEAGRSALYSCYSKPADGGGPKQLTGYS